MGALYRRLLGAIRRRKASGSPLTWRNSTRPLRKNFPPSTGSRISIASPRWSAIISGTRCGFPS